MGKRQDTKSHPEPERGERGKWLPGVSPNPGGQPKWVRGLRESLREHCAPLAARHLARVLGGPVPKDETPEEAAVYAEVSADDRTRAAKVVLEYTMPKPKATVTVQHTGNNMLAGLSVEELKALASRKVEGE